MTIFEKEVPVPIQGVTLLGPLELAVATTRCWKCKEDTQVVAIIAAGVDSVEGDETTHDEDSPSFVYGLNEDEMPEELVAALKLLAPNYVPIHSHTMNETTWANGCDCCGALQGAFYQHMEPDGPFFGYPSYFEGVRVPLHSGPLALLSVDGLY